MSVVSRYPVLAPFAVLVALLAVSVAIGDGVPESGAAMAVLGLAAVKVLVVVSEFVEVRGAASWLVGAWLAWGAVVFGGLAVLLAT